MDSLLSDKILKANAPFEQEVQWTFYELWHHQGRRARHGASMMGPDFTHWHGMRILARDEHIWKRGLSPEEAARLRDSYREKYSR